MLMCAAFLASRGAVSGMFLILFYFYLAVVCGVWLRVSKAVARFRECTARVLVPSRVHTHTHTHTHTPSPVHLVASPILGGVCTGCLCPVPHLD